MNWSAVVIGVVPPGVVTVMFTTPDVLAAGTTAVMEVAEPTVKLAAGVLPKETPVAPVKPVPVIVTDVPPTVEPDSGEMWLTVGP